jgi:hypothetical protein
VSNQDSGQGALFENNRRQKESHPNMRGELTLTKPLLKELVEMAKAGKEIKLSLSAWNKNAKSGMPYVSLAAQAYVEFKKDGDTPPQASKPAPQPEASDDDVPF